MIVRHSFPYKQHRGTIYDAGDIEPLIGTVSPYACLVLLIPFETIITIDDEEIFNVLITYKLTDICQLVMLISELCLGCNDDTQRYSTMLHNSSGAG